MGDKGDKGDKDLLDEYGLSEAERTAQADSIDGEMERIAQEAVEIARELIAAPFDQNHLGNGIQFQPVGEALEIHTFDMTLFGKAVV